MSFSQLETAPVFEDMLRQFRKNLEEAKTTIQNDIQEELELGMQNQRLDMMQGRLKLLDDMLEQTNDGSVLNDQLSAPKTQQ